MGIFPSLTLIIPTFNSSPHIGVTLSSVERQNYAPLEVIVIDASSEDRTLEIVETFSPLVSRIYSVADFNLSEMLNRGITFASGRYISFLFPGTTYIAGDALKTLLRDADADVIYCGAIQRNSKRKERAIFNPFQKEVFREGREPTLLPGTFFASSLFEKIGKFDATLQERASYALFLKICMQKNVTIHPVERYYVDVDAGLFNFAKYRSYSIETLKVLYNAYGWREALWRFLGSSHLRLLKVWWGEFKLRLIKR